MSQPDYPNRIFDPAEQLSRDQRADLQLSRLQETLRRASGVPFYRDAFAKANIAPDDITHLDDLRKLPLTTKADLREHYPLGFLAVDRKDIRRIHGSSGTTGKPTFVAYTTDDMELWSDLVARFLVAGGLQPGHLVQIAFGYGLFTGGFGLHYGVEKAGAGVVPAAAGNTPRQLMLMRDLQVDALVCTPSYALTLAEAAAREGLSPSDLPIRFGHFGGEPWTEDMREEIERGLGIWAFNNYGLSEIIGPGVSGECIERSGMHISEDHFLVECLDPETLDPVEPGRRGELVITALSKQAMPIIRYRTRDLASLDPSPCPCGRTTLRMSRVLGRTDDMLIIRGANVFPSQVEEALLRVEGTAPHYLIEVDRPGTMDEMIVKVEVTPEFFSDRLRDLQELHDKLAAQLHSVTGIRIAVDLVEPNSLERFVGKAKRVVDHRPKRRLDKSLSKMKDT